MAMKESGIAWIGEIPNEWEISKIKYICCEIGSGTTPDSGNALYYDGVYNWIQSGDLYNADVITNTEKKITELAISENKSLSFYESDFVVIAMYGASVGNVSYSMISGYTNQACCVLKTDINNNLLYLKYFLNSAKDDLLREAEGGTQPNINQIKIKNLNIVKPLVKEQKLIADFLDDKVGKIDAVLADLNKQVEILNAYKKSLITETVTKGLNPNVPTKDSGIDWIGKIPEHWTTMRVKNLALSNNSLFMDGDWIESDVIVESGIRYLTTGNVGNGFYKEQGSGYITEETFKKLNCLKVYPGDLMISRLNEPIGRACIVPNDEDYYVVAVDNVILRPDKKHNKKYLMYCMNTPGYAEAGKEAARGSTMQRVSRTILGTFFVPVAPLQEQELIADFLDKKCAEIDDLIADKTAQIEKMEKYKKSLIFEYVTGKKRVKEVV